MLILEHIGSWTRLRKEDLDDNFYQLLMKDSENHSGAPNENIVQNLLNIELLNVF